MRGLTGIAALDVVEWAGIAALLVVAAWRRSRVTQVAIAAALVAAAFVTGDAPLAVLVASGGGAGVVVAVLSDAVARRIALWAGVAGLVFLLPAGLVALSARGDARRVEDRLASLRDDITAEDPNRASRNLRASLVDLDRLQSRLDGVLTGPARLVPFASQQIRAASDLVGALRDVVDVAHDTVADINVHDLRLEGGRIPVDRIASLQRPAEQLEAASDAAARVAIDVKRSALVPPLRRLANQAQREARSSERTAGLIARFAANAPDLFGVNGPRRYFLLVQNPAEARASGGILGAYAEIAVDNGKLDLAKVGRDTDLNNLSGKRPRVTVPGFERQLSLQPKRYWQNFTSSADFPTVARVIEAEYAPIAAPLDGVISVDPSALAALLRIAGPVSVPHWPVPLTADNVVAILEHDQYVRFQDDFDLRELFMAEATGAIWKHATNASLALDKVDALSEAIAGGHIYLHATDTDEQSLFAEAGLAGGLPAPTGDLLAITNQNASGNKVDWFLERSVTYEPRIVGDKFSAELTIKLKNHAPTRGEPPYVIGHMAVGEPLGRNLTFLSVYSPWDLASATIEGGPGSVLSDTELGVHVYSTQLDMAPGAEMTVKLSFAGTWQGGAETYRLTYRPQTLVKGDSLRVIPGQGTIRKLETRPIGTSSALRWYGFAL